MKGVLVKFPFASVGVLFSLFSIAGFPLFAAFPVRIELLHQVGTMSVSPLIWMVAGLTGFIIAVVKTFFFITFPLNGKWTSGEKVSQAIVIIFGVLLLALLGLIPGLLQSFIAPFLRKKLLKRLLITTMPAKKAEPTANATAFPAATTMSMITIMNMKKMPRTDF